MYAAAPVNNGSLDCLEHLITKGANLEATNNVSAAPPAASHLLRFSPSAVAARRPCCPALTADAHRVWRRRRASAQDGWTALMCAVRAGEVDCLELLITKGANLEATNNVSAAPPAAPQPPPRLARRLQTPPARLPPPLNRVCVARRRTSAAKENGVAPRGLQRPRSLRRGAAHGGGRREPQGRGEPWHRGPRMGGVRGFGARGGVWLWAEGPCCWPAPRRLSAPPTAPALSLHGGRLHLYLSPAFPSVGWQHGAGHGQGGEAPGRHRASGKGRGRGRGRGKGRGRGRGRGRG